MKRRLLSVFLLLALLAGLACPVYAASVPQENTPDYKVAFYAFDCYHMQDDNGAKSGYGYEMMQDLSKYMQCTFSYVGYDKSASECVDLLRNGELDLYTAAKKTEEREAEFAFSTHPAITAYTCMNVKVGNTKVVAGDYSTYDGLKIGLLARHTYNDTFLEWADAKGFSYELRYYETPTELSNALIDGEVDALVNSYLRTPEDEYTIETFGETPYYIMARKEDQTLIDDIDQAMDQMNVETPNWRTDLFNKYYGSQQLRTEFTDHEKAMLQRLQATGAVVRGVMDPDGAPYSYYENGEAKGIAAELFRAAADYLGLESEIVPVKDREEYREKLASGEVDVWLDADSNGTQVDGTKYKLTDPYLTTTLSVVRLRGASGKLGRITVADDGISIRGILEDNWPQAELVASENSKQCVVRLAAGDVDAVLALTYTAQKLARDDVQNRLRAEVVPGAQISLRMGVNAMDNRDFYGLWEKALSIVAGQKSAEIVQSYVEDVAAPGLVGYLFDHTWLLAAVVAAALLILFLAALYGQSVRSKREQQKTAQQLSAALADAQAANDAKNNFFSKMSHDLRTPLNVVLGMTQIAQKYQKDPERLRDALESISSEGNYLLVLINSILDVNQLESGRMELSLEPFSPEAAVWGGVEILRPLANEKEQHLLLSCTGEEVVVLGDGNRFSQILMNIISNAIKYTENGGSIQVSLDCAPDGVCRFVCQDNGIGMTKEFVAHITEDYVRAEDSRVSKIQGTGLGMSVVKGFTELMHGTLTVESEPGKGSTFTVEIPFQLATEEQRQAVLSPKQQEIDEDMFRGKRVLLAEDNALNAEIAIELLGTVGLIVDWAEDGKVAVEKYEASEPGYYYAVFMDMQMPVMDGLEATKRIRASQRPDHNLRIFAMTANTFTADRDRCREVGMDGYIAKPIHVEEILNTLRDAAIGGVKPGSPT